MAKSDDSSSFAVSIGLFILIVGMFMLRSLLVQMSFNCAMPSIMGKNAAKISFEGAMCLTILCALLFTSSTTVVQQVAPSPKK
jgi:hypothetical protein